ncbi:hypothetical protein MKX08_001053 [Trichoderma sp. CBMAI-0020]|nr:hypothetical protein MKX08_001053 [Trichoderma sp. CBMAI-0020]
MEHATAILARQAAIDALLRYVDGLDRADEAQLESAFTEDATLDLSALSSLGKTFGAVHGLDNISAVCMAAVGKALETTHSLTNILVKLNDENYNAIVTCYCEAQHIKKGQAFASDSQDNSLLVKSRYSASVSKKGSTWRIERLDIVPLWSKGSSSVLG